MKKQKLAKWFVVILLLFLIVTNIHTVTEASSPLPQIMRSDSNGYDKYLACSYSNAQYDQMFFDTQNTDNSIITYPLNNDVLRAGEDIQITGTINDDKFDHYTIEYGKGLNPKEWHSTGITLTDNGQSPISDDLIAIWNTSTIQEPDFFTLKITVAYKKSNQALFGNHDTIYVKDLFLDPTLKEGWPQRIPWFYDESEHCYYFGGATQPVVCDLDGDSEKEIVVYFGGNPTRIYVMDTFGNIKEGWPIDVDNERMPGGAIEAPSIADVDNDGFKEIIVSGRSGIYIYRYDGSLFKHINIEGIGTTSVPSTIVLFDLDNDGSLEIIRKFNRYSECDENLTVYDSNGEMLEHWPQTLYHFQGLDGHDHHIDTMSFGFTQAIGNFDDDSDWEIVATACRNEYGNINKPSETFHHEGRVFVFNLDGTLVDGFPVDIDGEMAWSSPCVADIDNDGFDDIIVSTKKTDDPDELQYCNPNTGLYVLDRYGNILSGWPQLIGESIYSTPAIADFNNDGYPEIVISTYGEPFNTFIFDHEGDILSGWPQQTIWNNYRSPVIGDVDRDGNLDIVATAGNGFIGNSGEKPGFGGVYAWNLDGSLLEGFPKVTEIDAQASATIADIDNDGTMEIIASSDYDRNIEADQGKRRGTIYIWEIEASGNRETLEWPMFHHDSHYSGYYTPLTRDNNPPHKPNVNGPTDVKRNKEYTYTTNSVDPEGSQIYYWFDWGDGTNSGWIGPFNSGETISETHVWSKNDNFEVKVKAKDVNGYWSLWSDPLVINMPKYKTHLDSFLAPWYPFLQRLLNAIVEH